MKKLNFYFDYVSNNAYLAWTQLKPLADSLDLEVVPVPVLFAGLLNAHNNVGPAEIPAKRTWMFKNILRKSALLGVPIAPPAHHPFNPLLALRASSMEMSPAEQWRLIDGLFRATWVNGQHISDIDVLAKIAEEAGLDTDALLGWATSSEAKQLLHQQTESALSHGVFGVPSMLVEGELFFGFDDFPFLEQFVKGQDLLDKNDLEGWLEENMKPSSARSKD